VNAVSKTSSRSSKWTSTNSANILIIDDDPVICEWIERAVKDLGHRSSRARTLAEGIRKVEQGSFDVVFLDVEMPDGRGLDGLPQIRASRSSPKIIILAGAGDPDEAKRAILGGAWNYIEKSASTEAIRVPLLRALEYRAEQADVRPPGTTIWKGIVGTSRRLSPSLEMMSQAAGSDVNVLITGETGTGKELFAKAIHANSRRARGNFVIVDCTALPETLVESVLFGHIRGAYTGADRSHPGLIKHADHGTLFLDEIGELPLSIQKSFLRVIQEHRFRPVGAEKEIQSDFRLIAATNRELDGMVRAGAFREDLFHRLRTLVIELPPLRESRQDIQDLAEFYARALCDRFGMAPKRFSPEFMSMISEYRWPGNVRELIQALEKALLSAKEEPVLFPIHLPTHIRIQVASQAFRKTEGADQAHTAAGSGPVQSLPKMKDFRRSAVSEAEARYLRDLLRLAEGDFEKALEISGLSRSRLFALLKKTRPA